MSKIYVRICGCGCDAHARTYTCAGQRTCDFVRVHFSEYDYMCACAHACVCVYMCVCVRM